MHTNLICYLYGVGAWGPGFANWADLQAQFRDPANIPPGLPLAPAKAEVIPGNERRRAPPVVKAAVEVSAQATQAADIALTELACVFGSGLGDTEITDYLCTQLASPEKQLSPTRFHNSVHNAPAGYWTIATHCMRSANSIAAYYQTAGISLLEAAAQATQEQVPVLVTLYDLSARGLYGQVFTVDQDFAAALVMTPQLQQAIRLLRAGGAVAFDDQAVDDVVHRLAGEGVDVAGRGIDHAARAVCAALERGSDDQGLDARTRLEDVRDRPVAITLRGILGPIVRVVARLVDHRQDFA